MHAVGTRTPTTPRKWNKAVVWGSLPLTLLRLCGVLPAWRLLYPDGEPYRARVFEFLGLGFYGARGPGCVHQSPGLAVSAAGALLNKHWGGHWGLGRFWPRVQFRAAGKSRSWRAGPGLGCFWPRGGSWGQQVSGASSLENSSGQQGNLRVGVLVQVSGAFGVERAMEGSRSRALLASRA